MQREGDDILQAARLQAERMVQRTEIVREAQATARRRSRTAGTRPAGCGSRPRTTATRSWPPSRSSWTGPSRRWRPGGRGCRSTPPPVLDGPTAGIAGIELDDTLGGEDAFFDQDRT